MYEVLTCCICGLSSLGVTCKGGVGIGLLMAGRRGRTCRGVRTNVTPLGLFSAWFNNLGGAGRVGVP